MLNIPNKHIILFDGVCNLCNSSVDFILKHDKNNRFYFASLQSDFGQALLMHYQMDSTNFDTFLYYNPEKDKLYTRSTAALSVLPKLSPWYCKLVNLGFIFPVFIRDGIYNLISQNRYKWFGKKETCALIPSELKYRFL